MKNSIQKNLLRLTEAHRTWLREARKKLNLSRRTLAEKAKLHESFICSIEGKQKTIGVDELAKLNSAVVALGGSSFLLSSHTIIPPTELLETVIEAKRKLNVTSNTGFAQALGVSAHTITRFLRGVPLAESSYKQIRAGLKRLEKKAGDLVNEGLLPKPVTKATPPAVVVEQVQVIQPFFVHAPRIPTENELDLMILTVLQSLKGSLYPRRLPLAQVEQKAAEPAKASNGQNH